MKSKIFIKLFSGLLLFVLIACEQTNSVTVDLDKFETFKHKEKFLPDSAIYYTGIADELLKPVLVEKLNQVADDFRQVAESGEATDEAYREKIQIGLESFRDVYLRLDTEDKERVCLYFEELMDIVGLESSNGLLNEFVYGFNMSM